MLIKSLLATAYSVFLFQGKFAPADGRCDCSWECVLRTCQNSEDFSPKNYVIKGCNDIESQVECAAGNLEVDEWVGSVVQVLLFILTSGSSQPLH
jgi:hypothetical protein